MTAGSLRGIICQRQLPGVDENVVLASEMLVNTNAVANIIRDGKVETWIEGSPLNGPNGLYWSGGTMMLASFGDQQFKKIDIPTKEISVFTEGIGQGDGIAMDSEGNFVVSSWAGQIFYIDEEGNKQEILNTQSQNINSADIDMIPDSNIILVPTFFDNRVVAYELKVN